MEDQYDELKQAYDFFDRDGGGISKEEIADAMKSFGKNISDDELQAMIDIADKDGNGQIDFEEFMEVMSNLME